MEINFYELSQEELYQTLILKNVKTIDPITGENVSGIIIRVEQEADATGFVHWIWIYVKANNENLNTKIDPNVGVFYELYELSDENLIVYYI